MTSRTSRPALRPVESIVVPDPRHGKVLVLRDTKGVTDANAAIPPALVPIVARFNGLRTCEQIARDAAKDVGEEIPVELVIKLADELERGLFLEGPRYREALAKIESDFAGANVRAASHAGGAYFGDAAELRRYLEEHCLDAARPRAKAKAPRGRLTGLVAPHIDPWRGAVGYGHAYGALRQALDAQEVDTFILLGTSHSPMRKPFALCRKGFATPLGTLHPDVAAIDALADAAPFDAYADQFNHKREHSLEFQVVFLKHLLGERRARIVPVLAGLGEHQAHATDPATDAAVETFLGALRTIVEAREGRAVVVAGADLAHIGPRFGDERPDAARLTDLDEVDRRSLRHAIEGDARGFWEHVVGDLDTRRVCGLAPIYSLLRSLPSAKGHVLHYEQTVDKDDGSVVSHAALGYFE
ncbi:MAG TPA: AmmeMemoRadiSam system protein B [Polyangiaceae bacterium]